MPWVKERCILFCELEQRLTEISCDKRKSFVLFQSVSVMLQHLRFNAILFRFMTMLDLYTLDKRVFITYVFWFVECVSLHIVKYKCSGCFSTWFDICSHSSVYSSPNIKFFHVSAFLQLLFKSPLFAFEFLVNPIVEFLYFLDLYASRNRYLFQPFILICLLHAALQLILFIERTDK